MTVFTVTMLKISLSKDSLDMLYENLYSDLRATPAQGIKIM